MRVDAVVISSQHDPDISNAELHEAIREEVIKPVLPAELPDDPTTHTADMPAELQAFLGVRRSA